MDAELVAASLAAGEGEHTEFKEKYSSRVIESLVAFANTAGGRVLIGVNDRGQVVSLPDADKVVESVLSCVSGSGEPTVDATGSDRQAPGGCVGRGAG